MHDDDEHDFDQPVRRPELPAELRQQLFDYSDPNMPAIRYSAIGPEKWPAAQSYGAKSGFTTWRNPRRHDTRIFFNLGPDAALHVGFEMNLIPPKHRVPRGQATALMNTGQALRREYNRMLLVIPAGEQLVLPAVFDSGIRTERNGVVIAGHAPFLVKVVDGHDETDPPELAAALRPAEDPDDTPSPAAAARRRS